MDRYERATTALAKLLMWVGCLAVVLMAVHVTWDVIQRTFFGRGMLGTTEIVSFYYMVAVVCFPLAWIERRDEHINVEILFQRMPVGGKRTMAVFAAICSTGFFSVFAYRSWHDALNALSTGETMMGYAEIAIWPARFILPISFALVVLVCLGQIARLLAGRVTFAKELPPEEDATFRA
ncbi:TRAP transporter small permease [Stella sp.]|uniref:TRAP transporter small permease n=1 Tax=Stella sp. TaxID=2912054 RepID=UPI0035B42421